MEIERTETQVKELMQKTAKQQRAFTVWCAISLILLAFIVVGAGLIIYWTGDIPMGSLTPFLILAVIDIPLLIGTFKSYSNYRKLSKELKACGKTESASGDLVRNFQLLEKEYQAKTSLILCPVLLILAIVNSYTMVITLFIALCCVFAVIRYLSLRAKVKNSGITQEERDAFNAEAKKTGKTKRNIVVIVLVIVLIIAASVMDGGRSSSSGNQPWKELGVSEREYKEIYNRYKYGE